MGLNGGIKKKKKKIWGGQGEKGGGEGDREGERDYFQAFSRSRLTEIMRSGKETGPQLGVIECL